MTTTMTDDEQLLDWIENANNGEGPVPNASIEREDMDALIAAIKERDEAEKHLAAAVAAAHSEGKSWAVIGAALGMTRQGAHTKYASA